MEKVRIIEIPASKMIKTPEYMAGSEDFFRIKNQLWVNVVDRHTDIFPRYFEQWNESKWFWLYSIIGIDVKKFDISGFEIIDFVGGYYATATAIADDEDSMEETEQEINDWVTQSKFFKTDFNIKKNRCLMHQRPLGDKAEDVMEDVQLDIFVPIKRKK